MTRKNDNKKPRENFASQFGLIMAAVGSAVGLGNVWRFSYITGVNGGGAFLLVYVVCVLLVGLPVLISELTIGRKSALSPVAAFRHLAPGSLWWVAGALGVLGATFISAYYPVVTGWALGYVFESLFNWTPIALDPATAFAAFSSGGRACLASVLALACALLIVFSGVSSGIEKWSRLLMPAFGLILLVLLVRSLTLPGAFAGVEFLLLPDFSKLTARGILDALGHSFYSLSVGMGIMITYASYMKQNADLVTAAAAIISLDTLVALLAGLAVFPAVFALGLEPAQGAGLAFATLPAAFARMPGGQIFSALFFLLLFIAALTSLISLLQVPIAFLKDSVGFSHFKATLIVGLFVATAGIPSILSFGPGADWVTFGGRTWFDLLDSLANLILPLTGLLGTAFVIFRLKVAVSLAEFLKGAKNQDSLLARIYAPALRWAAPVAIILILLNALFF
jgi:NSS family neurotransmitter:Na+ symporter